MKFLFGFHRRYLASSFTISGITGAAKTFCLILGAIIAICLVSIGAYFVFFFSFEAFRLTLNLRGQEFAEALIIPASMLSLVGAISALLLYLNLIVWVSNYKANWSALKKWIKSTSEFNM